MAPKFWAIRRTTSGSRVTCQGLLDRGHGKCKKQIASGRAGVPAPCFEGRRVWDSGTKCMWVWCCNTTTKHVWNIDHQVIGHPPRPPMEWPVAEGTNLSREEQQSLQAAGFHLEMMQQDEEGEARVGRYRPGVSKEASTRLDKCLQMTATIHEIEVVKKEKHEVFLMETEGSAARGEKYRVTLAKNPLCTCKDF